MHTYELTGVDRRLYMGDPIAVAVPPGYEIVSHECTKVSKPSVGKP